MIILYCHRRKNNTKSTQETKDFIRNHVQSKYTFVDNITEGLYGYWEPLTRFWGVDDILIMEGDVVPTPEQLEEMIDCSHPNCAGIYDLVLDGEECESCRDFNGVGYTNPEPRKGDFCDACGLGFTKFSKELQLQLKDWFLSKPQWWRFMDAFIMKYINENIGKKTWHVHSKIKHNHTWKPEDNIIYTESDFKYVRPWTREIDIYLNTRTGKKVACCIHEKKPGRLCLDCYETLSSAQGIIIK